uniref:R15P Isomerase n=1 Tax=uncultured Candidatus Micrarchaeota archaeon TaxID=2220064 RepID=A0A447IU78_9ARCH|nr:R15P Isomerase [uncultured Candidatus Micrarchaeota archaeon]
MSSLISRIKTLRVQGAEQIAEAAIASWKNSRDKKAAEKKLIAARPTEPMLRNSMKYLMLYGNPNELLAKLQLDKKKISEFGANKIKNNMAIFTHCHSSSVVSIFQKAKSQRKKFSVLNTETRPSLQGKTTAAELAKLKIPETFFVDSAARLALMESDIMIIGADAITSEGSVINKIGSGMFAEVADRHGIQVYVCSHSWKLDPRTIKGFYEPLEKRKASEIWKNPPRGVKISNTVFEEIDSKLIEGIISELGVLSPDAFVEEVKDSYSWMFK